MWDVFAGDAADYASPDDDQYHAVYLWSEDNGNSFVDTGDGISDELIPHIYKLNKDWHVWWASIPEAGEIVRDIWDRNTGQDTQIVFVDDDKNFEKLFLGNKVKIDKKKPDLKTIKLVDSEKLNQEDLDTPLLWINPGEEYQKNKVNEQIDFVIDKSEKKLLVFIIDLIFRTGKE